MSKFKIIDMRTQEILEQFPETRENDHLLYIQYVETYHYQEFNREVFAKYKKLEIPPFSSIERSGRDLRRKFPNLRGTSNTQKNRSQAEAEYRESYKSNDFLTR